MISPTSFSAKETPLRPSCPEIPVVSLILASLIVSPFSTFTSRRVFELGNGSSADFLLKNSKFLEKMPNLLQMHDLSTLTGRY